MLNTDDLQRARATFSKMRQIWIADSLLDAHERLSLVTVAARLRKFAFLSHLKPSSRREAASLLSTLGFESRVLNIRFDFNLKLRNVSTDSTNAYTTNRAHQRFLGLGV